MGGPQSRFSVQSMRRAEEVETSCAVETVVEATFEMWIHRGVGKRPVCATVAEPMHTRGRENEGAHEAVRLLESTRK